ncbi:hypothetical protein [Kitasatospora sp. NBC_01300]|uniref:hypothetical protein n=1 Tax=Kitasatospora sp. NBC_01300 TaxID=2903574 RepID=UPI002F919119|nr:hypothetical protein OG556_40910 [Kitasatospora sp. NBC_01300]
MSGDRTGRGRRTGARGTPPEARTSAAAHSGFAALLTRSGVPARAVHLGDDWSVGVDLTIDGQPHDLYLRLSGRGGALWQIDDPDGFSSCGSWPPARTLAAAAQKNLARLRRAIARRGAAVGHPEPLPGPAAPGLGTAAPEAHPALLAARAVLHRAGLRPELEVEGPEDAWLMIKGPHGVRVDVVAEPEGGGGESGGLRAVLVCAQGFEQRELYDSRVTPLLVGPHQASDRTDAHHLTKVVLTELVREALENDAVAEGVEDFTVTAHPPAGHRLHHDVALPADCRQWAVRSALAALRSAGWRVHQQPADADGRPVLRFGDPVGPGAPFSNLGKVDQALWTAGFDRVRYGSQVDGYELGYHGDHGVYVGTYGPGAGSPEGEELIEALTEALVGTGDWRVERAEYGALVVTAVPTAEGEIRTYAVQVNLDFPARSPEEAARLAVEPLVAHGPGEVEVFETHDVDRRWAITIANVAES